MRAGVGGSEDPTLYRHKAQCPTSPGDVDYLPFRMTVTPRSRTEGRPGHSIPRQERVTPESHYSVSTLLSLTPGVTGFVALGYAPFTSLRHHGHTIPPSPARGVSLGQNTGPAQLLCRLRGRRSTTRLCRLPGVSSTRRWTITGGTGTRRETGRFPTVH